MEPDRMVAVLVGLTAAGLLSVVMLWYGFKRLGQIRRRSVELTGEHERLLLHSQTRLAAQRQQALAEQSSGAERVEHLQRAHELWREALRSRRPDDAETEQHLRETIELVESLLREEGIELERGA